MELEEAIKVLVRIKKNQDRCAPNVTVRNNACRNIEAIETVLKELNREDRIINSLKIALKERTNERDRKDNQISKLRVVTTKQEKMIELMSRFIDTELSSEHLSKVLKIDVKPLETYREDIKQYFEKKAEEAE